MTLPEIVTALTDRQAVGLTIFGESRNEQIIGQLAVGCVIRNRLRRPHRFGATWKGVCLKRWQFSCWLPQGGEANYAAVLAAAERVVNGHEPAPRSALAHCLWVADGVMQHGTPDVTHGADHYLTVALLDSPKAPGWTLPPAREVARLGAHVFFAAP